MSAGMPSSALQRAEWHAMARWLALVFVLLLVLLQMKYWVGDGGVREVESLQARIQVQAHENAQLKQRNAALVAEVEELRAGKAAMEERARSELGLIKPGETFYRIVEMPQQPSGAKAPSRDAVP